MRIYVSSGKCGFTMETLVIFLYFPKKIHSWGVIEKSILKRRSCIKSQRRCRHGYVLQPIFVGDFRCKFQSSMLLRNTNKHFCTLFWLLIWILMLLNLSYIFTCYLCMSELINIMTLVIWFTTFICTLPLPRFPKSRNPANWPEKLAMTFHDMIEHNSNLRNSTRS